MRRSTALVLGLLLAVGASARPRVQVVFSPEGGFAPGNRSRKIRLRDGSTVEPNLNVLAQDMIKRVKKGGRIELAMYAFSDFSALDAMVDRARAGADVRMVLDASAAWTTDLRKSVFEKLEEERAEARKAGDPFDFQVKTVPCEKFVEYGRSKELRPDPGEDEGKVITGTMHEKFGVFFLSRRKMPSHAFAGSANFSRNAAEVYAENRTFFWDDPVSAYQLHEEFQRLWKHWGECAFGGPCETIGEIRDARGGKAGVEMVFNGEPWCGTGRLCDVGKNPADVKHFQRIDKTIERVLGELRPQGTVDFAMFSFTHWRLMHELLDLAEANPKARFRLLLDLSMLAADNPDRPGVLGPAMEKRAEERGLDNFEVRYKWRSNAHSYDPDDPSVPPGLYHFKSDLLHHKMVIVNGELLATGSYNWSGGAEHRNLENMQVFDSSKPGHSEVVDAFKREFDFLWNATRPDDPELVDRFRENPQVIPGKAGRALQDRIVEVLKMRGAREVTAEWDKIRWEPREEQVLSVHEISKSTGLSKRKVRKVLEALREVTMLRKVGRDRYGLAD